MSPRVQTIPRGVDFTTSGPYWRSFETNGDAAESTETARTVSIHSGNSNRLQAHLYLYGGPLVVNDRSLRQPLDDCRWLGQELQVSACRG